MLKNFIVSAITDRTLSRAIPAEAWVEIVVTACQTFRSVVAPITSLTSGVGRLIEAKFDRLLDAEKVLAAATLARAQEKVVRSNQEQTRNVKAEILIAVIEEASSQTDPLLHELWSNLLAREFIGGSVHPEFPKLLGRLSALDVQWLAVISERQSEKPDSLRGTMYSIATTLSFVGLPLQQQLDERSSFTHEFLASLNLIRRNGGVWESTLFGRAFVHSVSDMPEVQQAV